MEARLAKLQKELAKERSRVFNPAPHTWCVHAVGGGGAWSEMRVITLSTPKRAPQPPESIKDSARVSLSSRNGECRRRVTGESSLCEVF